MRRSTPVARRLSPIGLNSEERLQSTAEREQLVRACGPGEGSFVEGWVSSAPLIGVAAASCLGQHRRTGRGVIAVTRSANRELTRDA